MQTHKRPLAPWMQTPELSKVMEILSAQEGKTRFVGGCIRDSIIGKEVQDIDIATEYTPKQVVERLENVGIKAVPTGLKHGTVTAILEGYSFEITTLRRDMACDGRHAEVEFTDNWEEDAMRRDFTMNALSLTIDGTLYDYTGGVEDIASGIVRFVGDAKERVQEDVLRILRFFRFLNLFDTKEVDQEGLEACVAYAKDIKSLSGERISVEMLKLLAAEDPTAVLQLMLEKGILAYVIEATASLKDVGLCKTVVMLEKQVNREVDPLVRLATLLYPVLLSDKAEQEISVLGSVWNISNVMRRNVLTLVTSSKEIVESNDLALWKCAIRRLGKEMFVNIALLQTALVIVEKPEEKASLIAQLTSQIELATHWNIPEFPLSGADILALGLTQGTRVGELLHQAEDFWEARDFLPDKEALLAYIRERIA